jgi:hypothetical protein
VAPPFTFRPQLLPSIRVSHVINIQTISLRVVFTRTVTMKAIIYALTHKPIRSSAGTSLKASGATSTSGITASDNLGGASQASAEVLESMDTAFSDVVIGGTQLDQA